MFWANFSFFFKRGIKKEVLTVSVITHDIGHVAISQARLWKYGNLNSVRIYKILSPQAPIKDIIVGRSEYPIPRRE